MSERFETRPAPATMVVVKVAVYYALLFTFGAALWRYLPQSGIPAQNTLEALFGTGPAAIARAKDIAPVEPGALALTVLVAMFSAVLLSLPVAWVYQLTRAKRGYQQSVVQLLIVLPLVVAGVVLLVKYSIALAFSLAGIVAAVRFRNTLEDSKDAVYVFLSTGIGLAAAVDLPVAAAISVAFNLTVLALWYTDFGRAPVELEGRLAQRRLQRARELSRTGTFVARIDDEVLREMSREQLEGVAERALRRARQQDPETGDGKNRGESKLLVRTRDVDGTRGALEPRLDESAKRWRLAGVVAGVEGVNVVEYAVELRKRTPPDELLALLRAAGEPQVIEMELR